MCFRKVESDCRNEQKNLICSDRFFPQGNSEFNTNVNCIVDLQFTNFFIRNGSIHPASMSGYSLSISSFKQLKLLQVKPTNGFICKELQTWGRRSPQLIKLLRMKQETLMKQLKIRAQTCWAWSFQSKVVSSGTIIPNAGRMN